MKLPDFTQDAPLNALRQLMGASLGELKPAENRNALTTAEIEALTKQGIDVSLDAVHVLPDGTLAYKNSRVILYIRDIAYYRESEQPSLPRFHVADCKTLEDMRANNRFNRYVVATREDGLFALNVIPPNGWGGSAVKNISERLPVCQNCLGKLRWDGFGHGMDRSTRRGIVESFSIARFFSVYGKTLVTKTPQHNADTAPLNTYSADFTMQGDRMKAKRGYRCDSCGINLTNHRKYLHAHHRDGQKHDSRDENIAVLCVACHAEQYNHSHLKAAPDYLDFLRVRNSIEAVTPARPASEPPASLGSTVPPRVTSPISAPPSAGSTASRPLSWAAAAHEVARAHKLAAQDLRKDGGCLWVKVKDTSHPAAEQLKKLGFQFSAKRQAFWRKD